MSDFYHKQMVLMLGKLMAFGDFQMTYYEIDHKGKWRCVSSRRDLVLDDQAIFHQKFMHFLKLIASRQIKFHSASSNLYVNSVNAVLPYYTALIKKRDKKLFIYLFESKVRSDVVRLMLHRDVIKRFSLFMDENLPAIETYAINSAFKDLFGYANDDFVQACQSVTLLEETFSVLLTQKEKKLVLVYLELSIVKSVAERVGFSRSYVNQILLSAAHKLGLSRVSELLTVDQTGSVLFERGNKYVNRYHRLHSPEKTVA